jgi:hypothetical protein
LTALTTILTLLTIRYPHSHPSTKASLVTHSFRIYFSAALFFYNINKMATITGWVLKDTKHSLVGIAFSQETPDAPLTIKYIYKGGLFDSTDLVPGLQVVRINNIIVSSKSAEEAAKLMKRLRGVVSVTAEGVRASVEKPAKDSKVGISLSDENGVVIISVINPFGIFASSGLRVGQRVVSINGYVCPPSAASAVKIVQDAQTLTIVAAPTTMVVDDCVTTSDSSKDDDDSPSNVVISAKCFRPLLPLIRVKRLRQVVPHTVVSSRSLTSCQWSSSMVTAIPHQSAAEYLPGMIV